MKKVFDKIFIFEIILLIIMVLNCFVFKIKNIYEVVGILLVFLIISIFLIGYEKKNYRNKKDVILTVLVSLLIYYFIIYFLGIFFGFVKTGYSLKIANIMKNIFPILLIILVSEVLRYIVLSKIKKSYLHILLSFIIFVVVDINVSIYLYDITSVLGFLNAFCYVIIPSITKNILLTYITLKVGYTSSLIYRFITELSIYFLFIFPNFGEYINTVLITVLPILILFKVNNMFSYYEIRNIKSSSYNKKKLILYSIITFILLITVILTSGLFKYYALAIGSSSMSPNINVGDVVIVKKLNSFKINNIKKKDILVYTHDNKIIVHRVVKKIETNKKINFITKGDNNKSNDSWIVDEDDIIGVSIFKIKYLGMPTVMLNDLLSK